MMNKISSVTIGPLLFVFFFILFQSNLKAQSLDKDEFEKPEWANIIESNEINYYTVITAFEKFWTGKVKPVEEEDIFENAPSENDTIDTRKLNMAGVLPESPLTDKMKKELQYKAFLAFEYKRFKDWQQEVLPYVQPDGRILSEKDKELIWLKQKGN